MQQNVPKTRDEIFSSSQFEWVKTERAGEICRFTSFEIDNGVEYTNFDDGTRIRTDYVGDIVLMHQNAFEILGREIVVEPNSPILETLRAANPPQMTDFERQQLTPPTVSRTQENVSVDPVVSLLEKAKKRNERINLALTVKIPSPELYNVMRENFDNADEILLDNVMSQIQENVLREALRRELQNIYSTKKKKVPNGSTV